MFIGAAQPQFILRGADKSALDPLYAVGPGSYAVISNVYPTNDIYEGDGYASEWWPAPSGMLLDGGIGDVASEVRYSRYYPVSGANGRLGFVGVTRDQYGSALGNCTVRCFLTSTSELVSTVTSDSNGYYIATTPYGGAHYLVVHSTSPAVAGASLDTITPA